jgi:hypothetical protein
MHLTPEAEFVVSMAGAILGLFLAYIAFTRTKWARGA